MILAKAAITLSLGCTAARAFSPAARSALFSPISAVSSSSAATTATARLLRSFGTTTALRANVLKLTEPSKDLLSSVDVFIFDCDGVILDSNQVKTQAFYRAALPYGETVAQSLVDYHIQNGGISRYRKFEYFLQNIIGVGIDQKPLNELLSTYGAHVREGLLNCTIAPGLQELRQALPYTCWLVASGGDQAELHDVFFWSV